MPDTQLYIYGVNRADASQLIIHREYLKETRLCYVTKEGELIEKKDPSTVWWTDWAAAVDAQRFAVLACVAAMRAQLERLQQAIENKQLALPAESYSDYVQRMRAAGL